jgi:hypothetical protein
MCRNIRPLFNFEPPVTEGEVRAASLQFVRKISGYSKPSKANEAAFQAAVEEIAEVATRLLRSLETNAPRETARKKPRKRKRAQRNDMAQKESLPRVLTATSTESTPSTLSTKSTCSITPVLLFGLRIASTKRWLGGCML